MILYLKYHTILSISYYSHNIYLLKLFLSQVDIRRTFFINVSGCHVISVPERTATISITITEGNSLGNSFSRSSFIPIDARWRYRPAPDAP